MTVAEYFNAATRQPWIYGGGPGGFRGHDCTLFLANWVLAATGHDPASDLRETYSTREEAEAIVKRAGGFVELIRPRLLPIGWLERSPGSHSKWMPLDGDIAVFGAGRVGGEFLTCVGIRAAGLWVSADPIKLFPLPSSLRIQSAWSQTC